MIDKGKKPNKEELAIRRANKKKRLVIEGFPLEQLIKAPNCGFKCPNGKSLGNKFNCGCDNCGEDNGYFQEKDKNRLNKEDFVEIESLRTENGWLGKNGCSLPRKIRSEVCLRYVCVEMTEFEV